MKPSWTVARLLKEHPTCRKILLAYEVDLRASARTSIRDLAEEIEEDLDDFIGELDHAAQAFNEYDVAIVGDDDVDEDSDEFVDEDDEETTADDDDDALVDDAPLGDADDDLGYDDPDDDDDDDDDEIEVEDEVV